MKYGTLLFHSMAEMFSIVLSLIMVVIVWNTSRYSRNNFLLYLGIGYFWIAVLDIWHSITFHGIPFFQINNNEITLHFWFYTRLLEALLLLTAITFFNKKFNPQLVFLTGAVITLIILLVSYFMMSPDLLTTIVFTPIKIGIEILVIISQPLKKLQYPIF
ncbi:MAG: hypothetical protein GY928_03460 [Colwellia sp.]|nr:hypothetical protein [Colwellia sp.]